MPPVTEGYWGEPTATIDWCEDNYEVTVYIAEFWNTVTNLWMIVPPLHGLYIARKQNFETRFVVCYLALLSIGIGSWLFHMTLTYGMQLMDEVPMVFGAATIIYCIYQVHQPKGVLNLHVFFFLLVYCITFVVVYLYNKDPVFHEVMYGFLVFLMIALDCHLILTEKSKVNTRLFFVGILMYLGGFAIWNVDWALCQSVQRVRNDTPFPFKPITQLHGWWHFMAGYSTYIQIITCIHYRQTFLGEKCEYTFSPIVGLTVKRVDSRKKK